MQRNTLVALGVDHQRASVEVRERFALAAGDLPAFLRLLVHDSGDEAVVLSTCNRFEVYLASQTESEDDLVRRAASVLGDSAELLAGHGFVIAGPNASDRIFRIAAGLSSIVLGEQAVLGQVGDAYQLAQDAGTTGPVLSTLYQRAVAVGRRFRQQSGIDRQRLSVGAYAVSYAEKAHGSLAGATAVVVGSGESGQVVAEAFKAAGVNRLILVNRSAARAEALAERLGAESATLDVLSTVLEQADVVVTTTGASHPIIHSDMMPNRSILCIDIAVPRDIDPSVGNLPNVKLVNLDGLAAQSAGPGQDSDDQCRSIASNVDTYERWRTQAGSHVAIRQLRSHLEAIGQQELDLALRHLPELDDKSRQVVAALARGIVQKVAHEPTVRLRSLDEASANKYASSLTQLFGLSVDTQ